MNFRYLLFILLFASVITSTRTNSYAATPLPQSTEILPETEINPDEIFLSDQAEQAINLLKKISCQKDVSLTKECVKELALLLISIGIGACCGCYVANEGAPLTETIGTTLLVSSFLFSASTLIRTLINGFPTTITNTLRQTERSLIGHSDDLSQEEIQLIHKELIAAEIKLARMKKPAVARTIRAALTGIFSVITAGVGIKLLTDRPKYKDAQKQITQPHPPSPSTPAIQHDLRNGFLRTMNKYKDLKEDILPIIAVFAALCATSLATLEGSEFWMQNNRKRIVARIKNLLIDAQKLEDQNQ